MSECNPVDTWLSMVAYSHSNSPQTAVLYRIHLEKFTEFIGKTPEQIVKQYEISQDRVFRREYAGYVKALIADMRLKGYASNTINVTVNVIRSFFKYNDLPLGFVPSGSNLIEFHNRDITREEIQQVLKFANVRDRAFFCMLAQSGLRPGTLVELRLKDVDSILNEDTLIPCKNNGEEGEHERQVSRILQLHWKRIGKLH
ncbi:hypothetical protein KAU92_06240 [Candidatus Bathyarchaeota archaeon]|nr:hypothetical protein [Candidatus Bathyarchaeota archaeon]